MENPEVNKKKLQIALIFECFMSIFYLAFAYVLIGTDIFGHVLSKGYSLALGLLLAIYGIYRVYRAVRKLIKESRIKE